MCPLKTVPVLDCNGDKVGNLELSENNLNLMAEMVSEGLRVGIYPVFTTVDGKYITVSVNICPILPERSY